MLDAIRWAMASQLRALFDRRAHGWVKAIPWPVVLQVGAKTADLDQDGLPMV